MGSDGWNYALSPDNARKAAVATSRSGVLGMRHGAIGLHTEERPNAIAGRVYTVEPTGDVTYAHVAVGDKMVVVSVDASRHLDADAAVWLEPDPQKLHLFDGSTQHALAAS